MNDIAVIKPNALGAGAVPLSVRYYTDSYIESIAEHDKKKANNFFPEQ